MNKCYGPNDYISEDDILDEEEEFDETSDHFTDDIYND